MCPRNGPGLSAHRTQSGGCPDHIPLIPSTDVKKPALKHFSQETWNFFLFLSKYYSTVHFRAGCNNRPSNSISFLEPLIVSTVNLYVFYFSADSPETDFCLIQEFSMKRFIFVLVLHLAHFLQLKNMGRKDKNTLRYFRSIFWCDTNNRHMITKHGNHHLFGRSWCWYWRLFDFLRRPSQHDRPASHPSPAPSSGSRCE